MKCSICIATYNKPETLKKTLDSIVCQNVPFEFEVIVVNDGPSDDATYEVCGNYSFPLVWYVRHYRPGRTFGDRTYSNPAGPRNAAYRLARGEVIICQSDDVIHHSPDCIRNLVEQLQPKTFLLASVVNVDEQGHLYSNPNRRGYGDQLTVYVSPLRRRPLFFLGSLLREDLYAVGGNDEDFTAPSGEDVWFGHCLINGRGLTPTYSATIVGHHQAHPHCDPAITKPSQNLLRQKIATARSARNSDAYCSSGGPWIYP